MAELVYADEQNQIAVEILLGWHFGDSRSLVPNSDAHRKAWELLALELADIQARGNVVELVAEIPDATALVFD